MRLFDGLSSDQIQRLQACAAHMTFESGSRIFREGDAAMGLFAIISGEVEVTRKTPTGDVVLSYLRDGDTLGELGLIHHEGKRTATATAVARTHIFAIPGNPIRLFEQLKDWGAVLALIKNLVGVIGERMRNKDHNGEIPPAWVGAATVDPEFQAAIRKIKALLPQNPANPFLNDKTLLPGSFLFKEGERPDGFYFIHNGTAQVLKLDGNTVREVARHRGPTIVGELGFFSSSPRSASVRALDRISATHFSGRQFVQTECFDAHTAADVGFTAAKLAALLFLKRENAQINLG